MDRSRLARGVAAAIAAAVVAGGAWWTRAPGAGPSAAAAPAAAPAKPAAAATAPATAATAPATAATAPATAATAPAAPAPADLVIGEFPLTRVVDGDTVRVDGLDSSLRLIGIDTEEIFHHPKERRVFESMAWADYLVAQRGTSRRPVKMATPMGEEAKAFAQRFFPAGARVRLERDDPRQIHDRYGRYLAYVMVEKDGVWLDYNVECVRAGMSPYFTKYGRSRRFDAEFRAAEAEARAAHRGIWADDTQHYPDYAEREAWWNARADFVAAFEADAAGRDDFIDLADDDAEARIAAREGAAVTLLGTVGEIHAGRGRAPTLVLLSRRRGADFPVVFFKRRLVGTTGIGGAEGELVRVSGTVTRYDNPHTGRSSEQIVVDDAAQVTVVED